MFSLVLSVMFSCSLSCTGGFGIGIGSALVVVTCGLLVYFLKEIHRLPFEVPTYV